MKSLADFLDVPDPRTPEQLELPEPKVEDVLDVEDPKEFCKKILGSRQFRQYILNGIVLGDLPPGIVMRVMDHGWGKPPERHEVVGEGGGPVITEVRRIIVRAREDAFDQLDALDKKTVHDDKVTH
jgi:hypothetical protein